MPGASCSGQLEAMDVKRLKALELENNRLKKLLAERDLDITLTQEDQRKKMVSPQGLRSQLAFLRERGASLRRACGLIGMSRATPSYERRLPTKDAPVIDGPPPVSGNGRVNGAHFAAGGTDAKLCGSNPKEGRMNAFPRTACAALLALCLSPVASAVTTWDFASEGTLDPETLSFSLPHGAPFRFLSATMAEFTSDFFLGCEAGPGPGTPVFVTGMRSSAPAFTTTFQATCPPDPGTYLSFASPDPHAVIDEMTLHVDGLSFVKGTLTIAAVPEPSTSTLALAGAAIVAGFARRARRCRAQVA